MGNGHQTGGNTEGTPLGVIRGTLDLLVLHALRVERELHGLEIIDWIRDITQDHLLVEEGALYPALHRMERRGWVDSSSGVSNRGRRARFYQLTQEGRVALEQANTHWRLYVEAVSRIAARPTPP